MNVPIEQRWQEFVDRLVGSGRYASPADVVTDGLRLIEEREAKLSALRDLLSASITEGGSYSEDEIVVSLRAIEAKLADQGL